MLWDDRYVVGLALVRRTRDRSVQRFTLLFNIHTMQWDKDCWKYFPQNLHCRVADNAEMLGETRGLGFLPDGIPVAGMAGDQQAALFGQACFTPGTAKCTYGTGAFVLMNTGTQPVESHTGLLSTVGWRLNGQTTYALEGARLLPALRFNGFEMGWD